MDLIKKIKLDLKGELIELITVSAKGGTELREIKDMITREYQRRGYIPPHLANFSDEFENNSVYFGAYANDTLLAAARLINSEKLPTESLYYKFEMPQPLLNCPRDRLREVSRLTVLKRPGDNPFPRHFISTVIISSLIDYGFNRGLCGGVSTIKLSFLRLFESLNLPALHEITDAELTYPRDGVLSNFFYNDKSPAVPIYYLHDEAKAIFDGLFQNVMRTRKTLLDEPLEVLTYEVLV